VVPDLETGKDQQKMTTQELTTYRVAAMTRAERLSLDAFWAAERVKVRAQACYSAAPPFSERAAAARELVSAAVEAVAASRAAAAAALALLASWDRARATAPAGVEVVCDLAAWDPSRFRA